MSASALPAGGAPAPSPSSGPSLPLRFYPSGECRCERSNDPADVGTSRGCPSHDLSPTAPAWFVFETARGRLHEIAVSRLRDGSPSVTYENGDATEREADRIVEALEAAGDACEAHNHGDLAGAIVRASASFLRAAPREVWVFRVVRAAAPEGARRVLSEWTTEARAVRAAFEWERAGEACRLERRLWCRSHVHGFQAWNASPATPHVADPRLTAEGGAL